MCTTHRPDKYKYIPVAPAAMPLPADARIIAATLLMVLCCVDSERETKRRLKPPQRRDRASGETVRRGYRGYKIYATPGRGSAVHLPLYDMWNHQSIGVVVLPRTDTGAPTPPTTALTHREWKKPDDVVMSAIVNAAPALPIDPADWSYLAEGGFHIILRYDGKDPALHGRILRIGKKALGHQKEEGGGKGAKETSTPAVVPDEAGARRKFERGVLTPLLGEQYVQPGDAVTLSREDIGKIHLRCVRECCKARSSCSSKVCSRGRGGKTLWHQTPAVVSALLAVVGGVF